MSKGLVDGRVRMVLVQFSFSNFKVMPEGIRQDLEVESTQQFVARKSEIKGEQCLPPTNMVGCAQFLSDLAEAGYVLVDAFSKVRDKNGQRYVMVRFVFVEASYDESSPEFQAMRPAAEQELRKLATEAAWRVRAYLNPFFKDGEVVKDAFCISINLEAREPLVDGNGQPLLQWRKDSQGQRIGRGPVPVAPNRFLRIVDGDLRAQ